MIIFLLVKLNCDCHVFHQLNKKYMKVFLSILEDLEILKTGVIV